MSEEHKKHAPASVNFAVITLSDSRTIETDDSGKLIKELLVKNNHKIIDHVVIPDDKAKIKENITRLVNDERLNLVITNGGTGMAKKDVTIEAIKQMFDKELIAFNPLFSKLSYEEVGSMALVSRATAGIINNTAVFCLPGKPAACKLALEKLIIPEIGHIVKHLND